MEDSKDMAEADGKTGPSREEREAKRYVKRLKGFYMQVMGAGVLVVFLFILNLMTSTDYWWFLWPTFGLAIALGVQAVGLFGFTNMFGTEWEERQMAKRLNKK